MRANIYRAWDTKAMLMMDPIDVWDFGTDNEQGDNWNGIEVVDRKDLILMQLTGMEDSDKKSTFESDLILAYDEIYKVCMSHGSWVGVRAGKFRYLHHMYFKVIGNIYQNADVYYKMKLNK